jgi:creatinine amidohydrolase
MALLSTNRPDLWFEDSQVGRLFKELWEADKEQIDAILEEYGIPSP